MITVLTSVKGVSYSIDAVRGIAYVEGEIESAAMLSVVAKAGKHAELCRIDSRHGPSAINHAVHRFNYNNYYGNLGPVDVYKQQPPLPPPTKIAAPDTDTDPPKKKTSNCCMM
ncbi:hypothetical protein FNV43_RR03799 [Rhamnella rubrinervis]|uniref:HMA domain-containing protein n=1 Tax=Rhamnella rubrinervis TaxID=2594499 RepID=A0A8K0HKJ9_9ROSA|nr:hypothetical protein FNV43_RR03799 [Rhamnella rubrinervis]